MRVLADFLHLLMDYISEAIFLYKDYLINGAIITFLVVFLSDKFIKNKLIVANAFKYLKCILLIYSFLSMLNLIIGFLYISNEYESYCFYNRMTGSYAFAYWLMFLGTLSPLLLFIHKIKNSLLLLFIITIWTNIGWLMESVAIHTAMMHREYSLNENPFMPFVNEWWIILHGFVMAIILLAISNAAMMKQNKSTSL